MQKKIFSLFFFICCGIQLFSQKQETNYEKAYNAHYMGQYVKCSHLAKKAIKETTCPEQGKIHTLLAQNSLLSPFRLGIKKTLKHLEYAVNCNPLEAEAHALLGTFYFYEDPQKAIEHLKIAYSIDSNNLATLKSLGQYYDSVDSSELCLEYANRGLKILEENYESTIIPEKVAFFYLKGEALYYMDYLDEAIVAFDSVIALEPFNYDYDIITYYTRGNCYNDMEEFDKALEDLEKVAEVYKKQDPFLIYQLSMSNANKSDPDLPKALELINESIKLLEKEKPLDVELLESSYLLRGTIYLEERKFGLASSDFEKMINSEDVDYWLGITYLREGNYSIAEKKLLSYLEYYPDDVEAIVAVATCFYEQNKRSKACEYISEATEFFSEDNIDDAMEYQEVLLLKATYCK